MTSMNIVLRIQLRLDSKWAKTDLQRALDSDGVYQLWNEMVKDGEITGSFSDGILNAAGITARKGENGHYYCGMRALTCTCCDGICGPHSGCNCGPCQSLDKEEEARQFASSHTVILSSMIHQSWTWGRKPSAIELKECLEALVNEQKIAEVDHASNSLYSKELWMRLVIGYRYFAALAHQQPNPAKLIKTRTNSSIFMKDCKPSSSSRSVEDPTFGLARVGYRAVFGFACSFLRRAWRTGQDTDLCTELLTEALDALRNLPEGLLFEDSKINPMWLEIVDKSEAFLRTVVVGNVGGDRDRETFTVPVPLQDQYLALCLLLELAAQRGTLSRFLDCVLLLLDLYESRKKSRMDNRMEGSDIVAPLVPFLRRMESLPITKAQTTVVDSNFEIAPESENEPEKMSPTESFLFYTPLPASDYSLIDIKRAAVFLMAHLDRLAQPHNPPTSFCKVPFNGHWQEVLTMGTLGWGSLYAGGVGPQHCDILGELGVKQICCAERLLMILTQAGKVYTMYYNSEAQCPQVVDGFSGAEITKIATYPDAKHYLALTKDGRMYSWGCGDGGRLGHGDFTSRDEPTLIQNLVGKTIVHIACGGSYSAAITDTGELYTWGRGTYGRLGHGNSEDQNVPLYISSLRWHVIVDVACGSGDAQTLAVTNEGFLFSWGDGDYGKLGRGGSDSCKVPRLIEKLDGIPIEKVHCGAQFSVALTKTGAVYTWGKGDHFRLGHGTEEHVRYPRIVEALTGKVVKSISVGSMHTLALTQDGLVFGWGRNEQGQLGDLPGAYVTKPTLIPSLKGCPIIGIACGPSQSFVWSTNNCWNVEPRLPFVVDVNKRTLELLNTLLANVWDGIEGEAGAGRPPCQQKECIAVSTLNLLKLQLYSVLSHAFHLESLGLSPGDKLLENLKSKVVALASGSKVVHSVQKAAQSTLQVGWSLLIPTAEERARALSSLLPCTLDPYSVPPGKKFMTDLLVSSLTTDGGLEIALNAAIKAEMETTKDNPKKEQEIKYCDSSLLLHDNLLSDQAILEVQAKCSGVVGGAAAAAALNSSSDAVDQGIPLLNLVKQLIKSASINSVGKISSLCPPASGGTAPSSNNSASNVMVASVNSVNSASMHHAVPSFTNLASRNSTSFHVQQQQQQHTNLLESSSGTTLKVRRNSNDKSPSLMLLLRFQRLLLSRIFYAQSQMIHGDQSWEKEMQGTESLLGRYICHLVAHVNETISSATSVVLQSPNVFSKVANILDEDIAGVLFPELLVSLLILSIGVDGFSSICQTSKLETPKLPPDLKSNKNLCLGLGFLRRANFVKPLITLLETLNCFNRLAPSCDIEDTEALSWPGIIAPQHNWNVQYQKGDDDLPTITKADVENHTRDGGCWIILNGKVYDIKEFRSSASCGSEVLNNYIGKDASAAFEAAKHSDKAKQLLQRYLIGNFACSDSRRLQSPDPSSISSPLIDAQRSLSLLLGLYSYSLVNGLSPQPCEIECKEVLQMPFMQGGLEGKVGMNQFVESLERSSVSRTTWFEENGEKVTSSNMSQISQNQSPLQPHRTDSIDSVNEDLGKKDALSLLDKNSEGLETKAIHFINSFLCNDCNEVSVRTFLGMLERHAKESHFLTHQEFTYYHPIEQVGRLLIAVFLKHLNLATVLFSLIEKEIEGHGPMKLPRALKEVLSHVNQTKWSLVKQKQELNTCYRDVCSRVIERCRFLLSEIRFVDAPEMRAYRKQIFLQYHSRWRSAIRKILKDIKLAKHAAQRHSRPEDIVNTNIQSQDSHNISPNTSSAALLYANSTQVPLLASSGLPISSNNSGAIILQCKSAPAVVLDKKCACCSSSQSSYPVASSQNLASSDSHFRNCVYYNQNNISATPVPPPTLGEHEVITSYDLKCNNSTDLGSNASSSDEKQKMLKTEQTGKKSSENFEANPGDGNRDQPHWEKGGSSATPIAAGASGNSSSSTFTPRLKSTSKYQGSSRVYCLQVPDMSELKNRCNSIIHFVTGGFSSESWPTVTSIRRALKEQNTRAKKRLEGLSLITQLLRTSNLIPSSKYLLMVGWHGVVNSALQNRNFLSKIDESIQQSFPYLRTKIFLVHSELLKWALLDLRRITIESRSHGSESRSLKRGARFKENINHRDRIGLGTLSQARFILALIAILSENMYGSVVSHLISMGLLSVIQTLLSCVGPDSVCFNTEKAKLASLNVAFEEMIYKSKPPPLPLTGAEMAALMKVGTPQSVTWSNGTTNSYRMGKEGKYDLKLADPPVAQESESDSESFDEDGIYETSCVGKHPTALIRNSCLHLMRIIAVSIGLHSDTMQESAVRSFASLLKEIVYNGCTLREEDRQTEKQFLACQQYDEWAHLGFCRAITISSKICDALSSTPWINMCLEMVENVDANFIDLPKQVLVLRVLKSVLPISKSMDLNTKTVLLKRIFKIMGTRILMLIKDPSIENDDYITKQESFVKLTVPMTASHSSTVVEECVSLIRCLLDVREWCFLIRSFIQTTVMHLCESPFHLPIKLNDHHPELDLEKQNPPAVNSTVADPEFMSNDRMFCAVLAVIGGYDSRIRVGGTVRINEDKTELGGGSSDQTGVLCRISSSGRIYVQDDFGSIKRYALSALDCVPELCFNPRVLPESDETTGLWVQLISLAMGTIRVKDWTTVSVVYSDAVISQLLVRQQELLQILQAISVLTGHQELLRKVLRQIWKEEPELSTDDKSSSTGEAAENTARSSKRSMFLFEKVLGKATQPSPVKAIFCRKELEEAALTIYQHLAAINRKHQETVLENDPAKSLIKCVWSTTNTIASVPSIEDQVRSPTSEASAGSAAEPGSLSSKNIAKAAACNKKISTPAAPVVQQLMDMGFPRDSVEAALKALTTEQQAVSPSPETLVAWILEHYYHDYRPPTETSNQRQSSINTHSSTEAELSDSDSISEEFEDIDASGHDTCVQPEIFKKPSDFNSNDEYARYVQEQISIGMTVRCCLTFDDLYEGDIGKVVKLDLDGLHDLNVQVDWQQKGGKHWVGYIHVEMLGYPLPVPQPVPAHMQNPTLHMASMAVAAGQNQLPKSQLANSHNQIRIGDRVRLTPSLLRIDFGPDGRNIYPQWGNNVSDLADFGIVTNICGEQATVKFGNNVKATGPLNELSLDISTHPGVVCDGCFASPIIGPRFKCKLCYSYDYCQQCFGEKKCHPHPFYRINEAGVPSIFAGKPGRAKEGTGATGATQKAGNIQPLVTGILKEWSKCVKQINVSSLDTWAYRLIDGNPTTFWQSCGNQGKHWMMLEMQPNVLVQHLKMTVDPSDGSYMPSKVSISVGSSTANMKDLTFILIPSTAAVVTLLSDLKEYYRFIEINILQCRNGGIDCRIHGLNVVGRQRSDSDEFVRSFSFLASDGEEQEDIEEFVDVCSTTAPNLTSSTAPDFKTRRSSSTDSAALPFGHRQLISRREPACIRVLVWGLNDKDQLGGLKGSKIKTPLFSETLSTLKPVHICGGSKSLFIISQDGRVYSCGEGTNGRLGLGHSNNVSVPQQLTALSPYVVKKVAVHSGGKHAMALTTDGKVFSWGEGDEGKLGHGNTVTYERPKLVEALKSKRIREIACGSSHSAAITSGGELYTWGLGEYGRLGHGDNVTQTLPKLVEALVGKRVLQVACGSRDAQTLALTDEGMVYSWGDGDFGKLGRGGSEGCAVPQNIEKLNGLGVCQIECGAQFSLALTKYGQVWTWGKGDYFRLGHNDDRHVRKPTLVEPLKGKKIVHVAVGALHCLAVTDTGQVFGWGDNDHGQQGNGTTVVNRKPTLVQGLESVKVTKVACGSSHSVAWTSPEVSYVKGNETVMFKVSRDPLGIHSLGYTVSAPEDTEFVPDNENSSRYNGVEALNTSADAYDSRMAMAALLLDSGEYHPDDAPDSVAQVIGVETVVYDRASMNLIGSSYQPINSNVRLADNEVGGVETIVSDDKPNRPSLSKILVSLESTSAQQQALQHILNALQIMIAREIIVAALVPPHSTSLINNNEFDKVSTSGLQKIPPDLSTRCDSLGTSPSLTSLMLSLDGSVAKDVDMAQGGGEAPADGSLEILNDTFGVDNEFHEESLASAEGASPSFSFSSHGSQLSGSGISVIAAALVSDSQQLIENPEDEDQSLCLSKVDDFVGLFTQEEACVLVDLLKIGVAGRAGHDAKQIISSMLLALSKAQPSVAEMLLELCVTELEDVAANMDFVRTLPAPVVQESSHPYSDNSFNTGRVKIPGAEQLRVEFDVQCSTEKRHDPLTIMDGSGRIIAVRSGREPGDWTPDIRVKGDELLWKFQSDSSVNGWGWRFTVYPLMPSFGAHDLLSDRAVLSRPSVDAVMCLLDDNLDILPRSRGVNLALRLVAALAASAQAGFLNAVQRMWALQRLRKVIRIISAVILKSTTDTTTMVVNFGSGSANGVTSSSGGGLLNRNACLRGLRGLPDLLLKQYEYEEPIVRSGKHLTYSPFFKVLAALACDLSMDSLPSISDSYRWSWFRKYCLAARVTSGLLNRSDLPVPFKSEVVNKISEMHSKEDIASMSFMSQDVFRQEHDEQLISWLNRRPEDWTLSWGGTGTIYGWGHNHRGQLGGVEGAKVKLPASCHSLSSLRPVQIIGGEQTLFIVTIDGKVYATGYGVGGRLGIGGLESVSTPTLLESISHVFIKKVAVNSGGKHCLALSADGDVYSWGEGDDGKLGHGNKSNCDRPRIIEALRGKEIVDIACGGAHSAAITARGELFTWGKGRYGRLGHGDGEDQLRPKLVESLKGYKVIDVACGSGDAQTLCITDDDCTWSWGDGDYGKLGRGGSDGCKTPMKIESLCGQGVQKVECGSQFSVALTRLGVVYTWGKGDYHRLGHGTDDHVRRPKKVAALQGKKVICIATGSLHCVACTDTGEVYTGGTTMKGSWEMEPRTRFRDHVSFIILNVIPKGKKINKVTCGSAHTLAWTTNKPNNTGRLPTETPMEYDLLKDILILTLRNRIVLLHYFSDVFCPHIPMFLLGHEGASDGVISFDTNKLRGLLVSSAKEMAFRKVIHATMVRERQHGPVIELNRIQVKRARGKGGLAGPDGVKSVFGQMVAKMHLLTQETLFLPHRVWKVKFVGESVDDCGGGYSESIAEMCDELMNGSLPLLILTPNGREESGTSRDCFILNPSVRSHLNMKMFKFLGVLMGIAIRTGSPLSLNLAEPVWKQLAGMPLTASDLSEIDRHYLQGLLYIRDCNNEEKAISYLDYPFSTTSAAGNEVQLSHAHKKITIENRQEYFRMALNYRLHEFDEAVAAVREGMSQVVPVPLLSLFTGFELETMVCGSPDIPLTLLKSVATYKGVDPTAPLIQWFWEVMEEFTSQERSLFLRFVWGRTRLPRTIADFRGRDFVIQVMDKYNPPDHFLPESYTCFFLLKMPRYSCKYVLRDKVKYAIYFCKSIDTDEYARVAIPGSVATADETPDESNDGVDTDTSEDPIIMDYPSPSSAH
ncbi:E3 ubiquitin-protein ligase HERC2 [Orchesella cincta]|uniref:HECT-type E3 ubiquitin transferase n=1 Tax=Orchesella cincta TaxID=48709 RepID=A0A1D2NMP4_ORCCI|nr:E3 ubiquitin-protein ligase HERC2 [Orchesella cincta]